MRETQGIFPVEMSLYFSHLHFNLIAYEMFITLKVVAHFTAYVS